MTTDGVLAPNGELGMLPQGWTWQRLKELIAPDRGVCYGIVQPGRHDPGGVPMVNSQDVVGGRVSRHIGFRVSVELHKRFRRSTIRGGEILLTLVGANFGQVAVAPPYLSGFNCSRAVGILPVVESPDYVALCLRSPLMRRYMDNWANTTAQPTFNLRDVIQLPIPMPPKREREAITHVLGTLDDKIELNRRMNETLEAMARALFKSWFVDFGSVRAKAEGRDPGLPKEIAELFPDHFEKSEMGEVPAGWRVAPLSSVAEHPRRGVRSTELDGAMPYIALEHMPKNCIALSEWGTAEGLESNKFQFKRGEILFGKLRPYFHKVGVAPVDGVCSTDIVVMTPRTTAWFGFVLGHASSTAFVEYANAGSTGTKMPRTTWSEMGRYRVVIPSEVVAEAYSTHVRPAVGRIIASIHESRTLATLRDTLLPKLISGELRVGDAERIAALA